MSGSFYVLDVYIEHFRYCEGEFAVFHEQGLFCYDKPLPCIADVCRALAGVLPSRRFR